MKRLIECVYWLVMVAVFMSMAYSCAHAQEFKVLPEYKGWFVSVEKDSNGEIVSAKVKVPKLEIVQAGSIITKDKPKVQEFGWITDSITWIATDTTFEGDPKCTHDWVIGEPDYDIAGSGLSFGCSVDHNGGHCDLEDDIREKICRKCLRGVIEREKWFQHFIAPPKSEFELLKEKQRAKR